MPKVSSLSWLGAAKETAWGTAVAPTIYIPAKSPKPENVVKYIADDNYRGTYAKTYGQYQGPINATYSFDTDFFPDSSGLLLLNTFGTDTVTGTASPYTHKFTMGTAQPPSLTLTDYDAINARQFAGFMTDQLDIKFTPTAGVTLSVKGNSKQSIVDGTTPTPAFTQVNPFLGWEAALSIGGTNNTKLQSFDTSIKRASSVVFGSTGTQDPAAIVSGVMDMTGTLTLWMDDDTDLDHLINNDQPPIVITLTSGSNILKINMNQTAVTKAATDRTKEFVQVTLTYEGIYNTTDAGPGHVELTNSVASY